MRLVFFLADENNIPLAKYFVYSNYIREKAENFFKQENIVPENILALHLRNGIDFVSQKHDPVEFFGCILSIFSLKERACDYMNENSNFFASAQCLGFRLEKSKLTREICYPSEKIILSQTKKKIKQIQTKVLFVAADGDPMLETFRRQLSKKNSIKVIKYERPVGQSEGEAAHIDLYILSRAQHAILNCPSSFSAFAKRQRDAQGKSTDFWGIDNERNIHETNADL